MKTFNLDANIMNYEGIPEEAREADIICFCPKQDDLLTCRAAWREVLIDSLRRDIPITAIVEDFDGMMSPSEKDALCEMLSYVSFLFLDSDTAELFLKEPKDSAEEVLRSIHKRFGVCSVVLTDEGLAFDDEKITEWEK